MIPVEHEPKDVLFHDVMERCCLCRAHTRYWYRPADVALCSFCAQTATAEQIPTKREWLDKERALTKKFI